MEFKDHFSKQSGAYAEFRPDYPQELIDFVTSLAPSRQLAWDCGTGNGQAALVIAEHFNRVIATDPSAEQIKNAPAHPNVDYRVRPAEDSGITGNSIDLITVAQALHWFDFEKFYSEVRRVAVKGAAIACWGYGLANIEPEIDRIVYHFYREVVGQYWPPERRHNDEAYKNIPFPFPRAKTPSFEIVRDWNLDQFLGYISSWSAFQAFVKVRKENPLLELREKLERQWAQAQKIVWPIFLLAANID